MPGSQPEGDVEAAALLLFHELMDVVKERLDATDDLLLRVENARRPDEAGPVNPVD